MSYEFIASGGILEAGQLNGLDDYLEEGQRGKLELDLRATPSSSIVAQLQNVLKQKGVEDVRVSTGSPILRIEYRKGFPWLAIIVAAVLGIIALAILIIGWRFFREVVPEGLQPLVGTGLLILLIAIGLLVVKKRIF